MCAPLARLSLRQLTVFTCMSPNSTPPQCCDSYPQPLNFDRLRHAVDGLPKCAACSTTFKQWKGLRDHLLSGACPAPDKLQRLTEADAQGTAPETKQLAELRAELLVLPRHQICSYASRPMMTLLNRGCLVCNFWTPDRTKVKSHFRQAHPGDWARLHPATVKLCQTFTTHTIKGQACPFCSHKVHDRRNHPEQCPVLYQAISQWTRSRTDLQRRTSGRSPPQQETQSLHRYFGTKPSAVAATQPSQSEEHHIGSGSAWARTGSPRDPGWEGVARTPCEHGSNVLVLCRRLSDVNS